MVSDGERSEILKRIGRRWRESVDRVKEYEITEEEVVEEGFISSFLFEAEYHEAQRLKQKLLREYKGKKLEEVINGEEIKTERGTCYYVLSQNKVNLTNFDSTEARRKILSDLKLLYGIGEITEWELKREGYKTIEDLVAHPRFGAEATRFLELLEKCDVYHIIKWIGRWFPKSHPLVLYSSGFHRLEDFIFLDIETMGLFSRPIVLLGIAQISGSEILINQYLVRDISEEPGALVRIQSHLGENAAFITFNGHTFDIPYLRERVAYYGVKLNLERPNFDLLHFSRRAWKEKLPNCRLSTLEKYLLGVERKEDVPSALVPEFYETYLRTRNPGPIIPILEHNRQDLVTLANIFSRLWEEWQ